MHLLRVSVVRVQNLMLQVHRQLLLLTSRGWAGYTIHIVINVNISMYEVYIRRMSTAHPQSETQFCVTTDRYAAVI